MPICMVIGAQPASIVYCDNAGQLTAPGTQSNWVFAGTSIGAVASDRLVIVIAAYINTVSTAATCTIAGVAATEVTGCAIRSTAGGSTEVQVKMFTRVVSAGTTATIVVSTGTATGCFIGVWSAYDLLSTTATDTARDYAAGTSVSLNLNVDALGVACGYGLTPNAVTWTGLTEDVDAAVAGIRNSGASVASTAGATPLTVTVNTSPGTGATMCAASFR